jgi:CMP-N-acetylneuraminic acid synthetase
MPTIKDKNIIALIPARGGSKSIPKKNIVNLGGFPLIAYSIIAAKMSKHISRIIVSTDSLEIAEIAKSYGAEVPFLRPAEFAADTSTDYEIFKHAMEWLEKNENFKPEYWVHLRPTTPLRNPELVDKGIKELVQHKEATSLRSGYEMRESSYKCFIIENGFFKGLFPQEKRPDYTNLPRQLFPKTYQPDGYVDVIKRKTVIKEGVLYGSKILAFITPNTGELDTLEDLEFIKFKLERGNYKIYKYLKNNFRR